MNIDATNISYLLGNWETGGGPNLSQVPRNLVHALPQRDSGSLFGLGYGAVFHKVKFVHLR